MNERLEKLVKALGITQLAFSQQIGVSKQAVGLVLNGSNKPGYNFILGILKSFPEVNIRWLYLGEGEMFLNGASQNFFSEQVAFGVSGNIVQGSNNKMKVSSGKTPKDQNSSKEAERSGDDAGHYVNDPQPKYHRSIDYERVTSENEALKREIGLLRDLLKSKDQTIELLLKK